MAPRGENISTGLLKNLKNIFDELSAVTVTKLKSSAHAKLILKNETN